jgi:hypothetical protein
VTAAHVQSTVAAARQVKPNGRAKADAATYADGISLERPPRSYDAAELMTMDMPDPLYVVRPYAPEGVVLIVGRPKIGKSTFARGMVHAVNTGGTFLSAICDKVPVLYLSLEEGERLMRKKLRSLWSAEELRGVRFEFEWPQGEAGAAKLRDTLREMLPRKTTRALVVIDSLTKFRTPPSQRGNAFTEDYQDVMLLGELCKSFPGLCVLVLHHTTKAVPDDPVSSISGTYGVSAAADSYLILLKQGQQFRMHAGGRLWEGDASDFELRREGGRWEMVGEWDGATASAQGLTPQQQQVLQLLKKGAQTAAALARAAGKEDSAMRHMCSGLARKGLITKCANGWEIAA